MKTYRVSEDDLNTMCEKLVAAQTLLNADAIAIMEGRKPLRASVRLDLAEEAEDLVDDVTNMLFGLKAQPDAGGSWGARPSTNGTHKAVRML